MHVAEKMIRYEKRLGEYPTLSAILFISSFWCAHAFPRVEVLFSAKLSNISPPDESGVQFPRLPLFTERNRSAQRIACLDKRAYGSA